MFIFAAMGNLTYVLSILCKSMEPEFLIGALPYLLGSGGTLVFDFMIFGQWMWYGRGVRRRKIIESCAEEFDDIVVEDVV